MTFKCKRLKHHLCPDPFNFMQERHIYWRYILVSPGCTVHSGMGQKDEQRVWKPGGSPLKSHLLLWEESRTPDSIVRSTVQIGILCPLIFLKLILFNLSLIFPDLDPRM